MWYWIYCWQCLLIAGMSAGFLRQQRSCATNERGQSGNYTYYNFALRLGALKTASMLIMLLAMLNMEQR